MEDIIYKLISGMAQNTLFDAGTNKLIINWLDGERTVLVGIEAVTINHKYMNFVHNRYETAHG